MAEKEDRVLTEKEAKTLAKAVAESLQDEVLECHDPFDLYVNRIKSNLYSDPEKIGEKIAEGHRLLRDMIQK